MLLGLPASELRDQRVPLAAIWDAPEVQRLGDRLSLAASTSDASEELGRAGSSGGSTRRSTRLWSARYTRSPRVLRCAVDGLAARLGVTDRTLHRRVVSGVGYGPKVLQRVARFRRFLAFARRADDAGLARLASLSGYADQAHLSRECNALAGVTPLQLVRGSDVRLVQDGLTRSRAGS